MSVLRHISKAFCVVVQARLTYLHIARLKCVSISYWIIECLRFIKLKTFLCTPRRSNLCFENYLRFFQPISIFSSLAELSFNPIMWHISVKLSFLNICYIFYKFSDTFVGLHEIVLLILSRTIYYTKGKDIRHCLCSIEHYLYNRY